MATFNSTRPGFSLNPISFDQLFVQFGKLLCVLTLIYCKSVKAHNEHTLEDSQFHWKAAPQIKKTLVSADTHTNHTVSTTPIPEGKICLTSTYFLFDINDEFAFDIDETITIEIEFDRSLSGGYNLTYDHAINSASVSGSLEINTDRWEPEVIKLDRARFANRRYGGTDFSLTANGSSSKIQNKVTDTVLTICSIKIRRSSNTENPKPGGQLTLNVKDESGITTSARVGIYTPEGKAPLPSDAAITIGHFNEHVKQVPLKYSQPFWPAPGRFIFYTDGRYTTELAPGQYELVVSKGPEYRIVKRSFNIAHNQKQTLDVNLKRWRNLPKEGWYSGDLHVHIARAGSSMNNLISLHAQAEDVHLSNLLQIGTPSKPLFKQYSFGRRGRYLRDTFALLSGQESPRTDLLGHAIGLKTNHFHFNGSNHNDYNHIATNVKQDGGFFGYAHVALDAFNVGLALTLDVPLGLVDFIEILQMNRLDTDHLYDFLNMGFRLLPSAGSDYPYIHAIGTERTYAKIVGHFDIHSWFDAWQGGRSFVSNGPVIEFSVNGDRENNLIKVAKLEPIHIEATASINPDLDRVARFELISNGSVVSTGHRDGKHYSITYETNAIESGWYALRVYGVNRSKAHSAPFYLIVDGDKSTFVPKQLKTIGTKKINELETFKVFLNQSTEAKYFNSMNSKISPNGTTELNRRIDNALKVYRRMVDETNR